MTAIRRITVGSIALLAVLGTAACGGTDDTGAAPAEPTPASADVGDVGDVGDAAGTSGEKAGEGAGAPEPDASRTGKTRPATSWYQPYVGTWDGHGRQLVIGRNGTGRMDGRTYVTCDTDEAAKHPGVPCEPFGTPADVSQQSVRITKTSRVYLEITESNDVNREVGKYRTRLSHGNEVLTVTFVTGHDGPYDVTYCAPSLDGPTSRDICG